MAEGGHGFQMGNPSPQETNSRYMRFISWNVNGLRAVAGKGFADIFVDLDADFFCLQETKLQEGQIDMEFPGYRSFWNYADKKGYSGTAIYSKHDPLAVTFRIRRTDSAAWTTGCAGKKTCAPISKDWMLSNRSFSAAT